MPPMLTLVGVALGVDSPSSDVDATLGRWQRSGGSCWYPDTDWALFAATTFGVRRMSLPSPMALLAPPWRRVVGTGGCSVDTSAECLLSRCSPDGSVPLANLPPPLAKARPRPRRMVRGAVQNPPGLRWPGAKVQVASCPGRSDAFPCVVCNTRRGGCRCRPAPDAPPRFALLLCCPLPCRCCLRFCHRCFCCFCLFVLSWSVVVSVVGRLLLLCLFHPARDRDAGSRWERLGSGRPRESWVWWCRGSVLRLLPPSPSLLFLPHHCGSSGAWNKRARRDGKRDRAECSAGWSGWLAPEL